MTTPGGVPNLPVGALTPENLAKTLQDTTPDAMKDRAVERFSPIFGTSTGGSPAVDLTPFGILTRLFAGFNSAVANADPNDIQGPEDLPELLVQFIESLPVVGKFVDLLEAILGDYDGDDQTLIAIRDILAPIRKLLQLFTGVTQGFPDTDEVTDGVGKFIGAFEGLDLTDPGSILRVADDLLTQIKNTLNSVTGGGLLAGVVGFWADFVKSLLGQGSTAIAAYTPENAAVATLQGQVNALMADSDPATNGAYDGFNTGPSIGSKWDTICGGGSPVTSGGYIFSPAFECYRYDDTRPGTTMWQVQASMVFRPGIGAGDSRIFGGADATLTSRFPAIEYAQIGAGNVALRIVSLAGTPDSAANANLGKIVHAQAIYSLFNFKTGDVLALEGIEDDGIYNLYLNPGPGSLPVCDYDDSAANLISRGVGHRDGGLQVNLNNDPAFPGNGWDNFSYFDRMT